MKKKEVIICPCFFFIFLFVCFFNKFQYLFALIALYGKVKVASISKKLFHFGLSCHWLVIVIASFMFKWCGWYTTILLNDPNIFYWNCYCCRFYVNVLQNPKMANIINFSVDFKIQRHSSKRQYICQQNWYELNCFIYKSFCICVCMYRLQIPQFTVISKNLNEIQ